MKQYIKRKKSQVLFDKQLDNLTEQQETEHIQTQTNVTQKAAITNCRKCTQKAYTKRQR